MREYEKKAMAAIDKIRDEAYVLFCNSANFPEDYMKAKFALDESLRRVREERFNHANIERTYDKEDKLNAKTLPSSNDAHRWLANSSKSVEDQLAALGKRISSSDNIVRRIEPETRLVFYALKEEQTGDMAKILKLPNKHGVSPIIELNTTTFASEDCIFRGTPDMILRADGVIIGVIEVKKMPSKKKLRDPDAKSKLCEVDLGNMDSDITSQVCAQMQLLNAQFGFAVYYDHGAENVFVTKSILQQSPEFIDFSEKLINFFSKCKKARKAEPPETSEPKRKINIQ